MAKRRNAGRSTRPTASQPSPHSQSSRAPAESASEPESEESYQVHADRPIRSIKLAGAKVPPWFRLFKAIVLNGLLREMTTADAKVLLCLGAFQSERNPWTVYPAIRTIADMTGLKERAVYNAVNRLIDLGIIKRESGGGRTANRYTLLPLAVDRDRNKRSQQPDFSSADELTEEVVIDDAPVYEKTPLHENAPVHGDARMPADAPEHRAPAASRPAPARSRYRTEDKEPSNSSRKHAAVEDEEVAAEEALRVRGVENPTRSKLLADHEPALIVQKCVDFDVRNRLSGPRKEPGWLVKSIAVGYALHPQTQKAIDRQRKADAKAARDAAKDAEADAERERQAAVDTWVDQQFEQADDEEWDAWHAAVLERYPAITRNLRRSDPRTSPKLRGLIAGMLAGMYDLVE